MIRAGGLLVFRTSSFIPERGSVLHRGIYNREFASVLTSTAFSAVAYMLLASLYGRSAFLFVFFITLSAAGFPFFRKVVFKERGLEVVFNRPAEAITLYETGMTGKKRDVISLNDIARIVIEQELEKADNPDGVEFVGKISAQHGMVIPGFGEETVSYRLAVKLLDGRGRVIYTGRDKGDIMAAYEEIVNYLGMQNTGVSMSEAPIARQGSETGIGRKSNS